jgi:ATP-dependent DNA ligase
LSARSFLLDGEAIVTNERGLAVFDLIRHKRHRDDALLIEVFEGDGDVLFAHACKLGCEDIVSKRFGSAYRSGRSPHWVKVKLARPTAVQFGAVLMVGNTVQVLP